MKKSIFYFLIICLFSFFTYPGNAQSGKHPYQNPNIPVEARINDLIGRMTTMGKIKQLDMYSGKDVANMGGHEAASFSEEKAQNMISNTGVGSVHDYYPLNAAIANRLQKYAIEKTRLGIPILFIEEGLHGYLGHGSTMFPIPLMLSSAWDTSMVHQIGRTIATETRAHGVDMILGPVLGLAREPRWSRVQETYGEDPYLDACNGVAMVKGLQGNNLADENAVISEPKHFAAHSIPEAGSNASPVSIGERQMRSDYLYVFEKAVREGGAMAIMAAYHDLDGIPCVDNKWLLTDVLRKEWGFKGFVLSDLGAISMTLDDHDVASSVSDALAQTFRAGMNMQFYDFSHGEFDTAMVKALKENRLTEKDLNNAVRDVLRVKFRLGLFDNPYTDTTLVSKVFHSESHQQLALQAGREGICLLKNDGDLLPLNKGTHSIAVIGGLATSQYLGDYSDGHDGVSVLDGLKDRIGNSMSINYAEGYNQDTSSAKQEELLKEAVNVAKQSDVSIVVIGEYESEDGEGKDRSDLNLDENQEKLVQAIHEAGKPVVVVMENGRPLTINWIAKNIPSIVETWYAGEKSGYAIADVLLGNVNPSGKLPVTFPRSVGQIPYYYDHKPTSFHRYIDLPKTPLFAFGRGLSYTTFRYSDLKISPSNIPVNGKATVSVQIENTGKVEGTEVVQLYVRDKVSSVTTPILALKGFKRITLKPGESGTVHFEIGFDALSLWNREMKHVVEPGMFIIKVGSASDDIRLQGNLTVDKK